MTVGAKDKRILAAGKISPDFLDHAKQSFLREHQLDDFLKACCRPLRKSIRINTLKTTVDSLLKRFDYYGIIYRSIPWCLTGFWLETEISLGNLPEHLQGLFYIQEASSMLPPTALLMDLSGYDSPILFDMAAAPGSKTTQIAAMVGNKGLILANEMSASRVKVLHANLVRCGVFNTCMTQFDGRKMGERLSGLFDFVLLDAPCGGEGTVRKDVNALKNWQLAKVEEIAKLQKQLITTAYQCLKPGGRLVYSTCTLSTEENQQVALHLVNETDALIEPLNDLFEGAELSSTNEGFLHVLPQTYDSEGFFVAAFSKPDSAKTKYYSATENSPFKSVDKKIHQQISQYYTAHFGFDFNGLDLIIKQRDKEIWLFPNLFDKISGMVRLNRSGIKLAEIYPNKIRSTHEFASCFGNNINQQKIEIDLRQAEEYFKGRNLELSNHSLQNGEVILCLNGFSIGLGGLQKNKIKNQLPRDLVKDQIQFF